MALIKNLRVKTTKDKSIQYQILTYCFFNDVEITKSDLSLLSELAKHSDIELIKFCKDLEDLGYYKSSQSARNAIGKCVNKSLIAKKGNGKKIIMLSPKLEVAVSNQIALDYKIVGLESKES